MSAIPDIANFYIQKQRVLRGGENLSLFASCSFSSNSLLYST